MNGAFLIDKHAGVSSFGVIELLQQQLVQATGLKRRDLPKLGHGGTLDPFATGLLAVCSGRAVKLARYFLGATKEYEGLVRFGETTVPGDPTSPISETSPHLPESLEALRAMAKQLQQQPYLQTPPMHSAKKKNGRPLYELARQGIEIEREPKLCHLYQFEILSYEKPHAKIRVLCSSGTYVRTLAQDFGRLLGGVAMLDTLRRTQAGILHVRDAWSVERVGAALSTGVKAEDLPCWVAFDRLLDGYDHVEATDDEALALFQGRQAVLFSILKRATAPQARDSEGCVAIYGRKRELVAVARREQGVWGLERVFTPD